MLIYEIKIKVHELFVAVGYKNDGAESVIKNTNKEKKES